jgi:hypothetical protein
MTTHQKLNRLDCRDLDHLIIVPFGDNHVGSTHCDLALFKNHLSWVLKEPRARALFMGDNIDCGTRDSVGASVYEQSEIIDEQVAEWCDLISPLVKAGKVIGTHSGNHEDRVFKQTGFNLTKAMADKVGIKYFGASVIHYAQVGNQNYTIYSTHGASGSRLPHTKIKAVLDRANMVDAEIYLMGHLHQLSHHVRQFYAMDKKTRTVKEAEKHFVLCGSYLTHWGSYAETAGYELMKRGSPKVKLSGLEKRIRVSL